MTGLGRAARLFFPFFLLLAPAGASSSQTPPAAVQSTNKPRKKFKRNSKSRVKILKDRHKRHRSRPA